MSHSDSNRIAVFIDGASLHAASKALGMEIDYRRLLKEFENRGTLLRAFYYTAVFEDREYSSIRPLIDWLDYNGFTVVTKPGKEFVDATGRRRLKGDMNVELTVHAMDIARHVDEMVIISGDGDLRRLVEAVQRRGIHVTVVSSICVRPMIADELRRQADRFIELRDLQAKIARNTVERVAANVGELAARGM